MKISFCIPSLNRPEYLRQTLNSICIDESFSSQFEICVYNNFSDLSYEVVENDIKTIHRSFDIRYFSGQTRLNIDESMFEAIRHARGEYLFFIGDDDYLLDDGLKNIFSLFEKESFDLAIFNAFLLDESNHTKTQLIGFSGKKYPGLRDALCELKKFCTYGNVLVNRKYIVENDFRYLIGTSHAYGCFWLAFFREFEQGINPSIIIPEPSVVCLRVVKKNYNLLEVVFKHADIEHKLYYDIIGEDSKRILRQFEADFWNKNSSMLQLMRYGMAGYDLKTIRLFNPIFFRTYRVRLWLARVVTVLLMPFKKYLKTALKLLGKLH